MTSLKDNFIKKTIPYIKEIKSLVKDNGDKVVDNITIKQLYGGARDVIALVTETSNLDPNNGISFRGISLEKLCENTPENHIGSKEILPEALFSLLLTGEIPSKEEIKNISEDWQKRAKLPNYVIQTLKAMPNSASPMVKFIVAISVMESDSLFSKALENGISKDEQWDYLFEDSMNLIASLPLIASYVYSQTYKDGKVRDIDPSLDWAGNFAHLLGDSDSSKTSPLKEFLRLHMSVHSDHEGGNASAFTSHVTGSTLASPYGTFAAGMHSLSGPLHGLATQTSLERIKSMINHFNKKPSVEEITEYIRETLNKGQVIPGYGHAVLRKTDPRFVAQMNFAKSHNMKNDILETVWNTYSVAPSILGSVAKIKNPYPNIDAHSGALLDYLGFKEPKFYTVFFGVARSLGIMAQQIWDRAFGSPIYRPKSVTSDWIKKEFIK